MKYIIIQGSSRSNGNTRKISDIVKTELNAGFLDLKEMHIHPYSYLHENFEDDFLPAFRQIVEYNTIIFITPVYWYTMSGLMKNFFDRISDCLRVEKDLGRKLRGKNMLVIACGSSPDEIPYFFEPFKQSAKYLGMNYLGNLHTWGEKGKLENTEILKIKSFVQQYKNAASV